VETDREAVERLHEVLRAVGAHDDHLGRLVADAPGQGQLKRTGVDWVKPLRTKFSVET
jgi:hypothetical protein